MPHYRSRTSTHGRNMAGARALWRATGMGEGDFGKPIIAIANSFTQFVPGHVHLKDLGQMVANLNVILGVELLCAAQGVEFRAPLVTSKPLQHVLTRLRADIAPLTHDRVLAPALYAHTKRREARIAASANQG